MLPLGARFLVGSMHGTSTSKQERVERWLDAKIATARQITLADVDSCPLAIKLRDGIARLFMRHL